MRCVTAIAIAVFMSAMIYAKSPVPRPAKEFVSTDQNGKKIALSSFKGKVVVVQYLDTTCPHCLAMSQMLTKFQAEYGPEGFSGVCRRFRRGHRGQGEKAMWRITMSEFRWASRLARLCSNISVSRS